MLNAISICQSSIKSMEQCFNLKNFSPQTKIWNHCFLLNIIFKYKIILIKKLINFNHKKVYFKNF